MKPFPGSLQEFYAGEGLFETLLVERGRVAFGREHLARMRGSASELGFPPLPPDEWVLDRLDAYLTTAGLRDANVRLNLRVDRESFSILTRIVDPFLEQARSQGVNVVTVHLHVDRRGRARHKWVERKTLAAAMVTAREAGAGEALLIAPDGCLLEGATSNVFCEFGGRLCTPPTDARILPGVTRSAICEIAAEVGLEIDEAPVSDGLLRSASEVFLTSAVRMLVPVIAIDAKPVGSGVPGPVARGLAPRLWERAFGGTR